MTATGEINRFTGTAWPGAARLGSRKELVDNLLEFGNGRNANDSLAKFARAAAALGIAAGKLAHQHGALFGSEPGTYQAIVVQQ